MQIQDAFHDGEPEAGALYVFHVMGAEKTGEKMSGTYYALILLFSLGMSGTTLAEDAFVFYIFWELMLLASVLLILIWGHGENRDKVALKYFINKINKWCVGIKSFWS